MAPVPGSLARLPNLKLSGFCSVPASIRFLRGVLPDDVPVVRLMDAGLAAPMAEYALYAVLHFQRRMTDFLRQQARRDLAASR